MSTKTLLQKLLTPLQVVVAVLGYHTEFARSHAPTSLLALSANPRVRMYMLQASVAGFETDEALYNLLVYAVYLATSWFRILRISSLVSNQTPGPTS